jgi:hypothetical protein
VVEQDADGSRLTWMERVRSCSQASASAMTSDMAESNCEARSSAALTGHTISACSLVFD